MASIYKRGKGKKYVIEYTDHTGKRRTVRGTADKQSTQRIANHLEEQAA